MKRERVEQGYHEDEAWNQQVARLDALKAQLRRKGVEDILKTIPAKLESVQEASMALEVDKPSKRLSQELESLVEISTNICLWLSLSLPCIHEGDFAEDLIHQILATFKALTSSAKRLSSAIVPDLMAIAKLKEEAIKREVTDVAARDAYNLAHSTARERHEANMQKWILDLRRCFLLLLDLMEKNVTSGADFIATVRPLGSHQSHHRLTSSLEGSPANRGRRGGHQSSRRLLL